MQVTPLEYISSKGWQYNKQGREYVIKVCPYCQDKKSHFYISENGSGAFFCHKCNQKGNLWNLQKYMGDLPQNNIRPAFQNQDYKKPSQGLEKKYHAALEKNPEALEYLKKRGFTQETIDRFQFGYCSKSGINYISIPHFEDGKLVNIKFRNLPPAEKDFRRIPGCKSILFNYENIDTSQEVYICEGELDAITLIQHGIENVVSGTTGAVSFAPEWIDELSDIKKIYICYDSDTKGREGAKSLARRLGYNRCFNVVLPEEQDINDYFLKHDIFDFQAIIQKSSNFDLEGVLSTESALTLLEHEKIDSISRKLLLTPFSGLNNIVNGFGPGELCILSAPPKTGKTTLALNISFHNAKLNIPVLFFCLEMRVERLIYKIIQADIQQETVLQDDIKAAKKKFASLPLYFAHSYKKQSLEDVLSLIREAIKRYDLKFVVFDNLHFLIRTLQNVNEELGQAVQGFKLLAEEMEIPIMAIAQPRKREVGKDEIMRADDIKYSNSVHADCDQMIILHRKRLVSKAKHINSENFTAVTEAFAPITLARVEAHRYGPGGETLLYYHGNYSWFEDYQKEKHE